MCGILGVIGPGGLPGSIDAGAIDAALRHLAHRGPDDRGQWQSGDGRIRLGHTRLAVIAPGPVGRQPFVGPSGAVLVYNGELYNDAQVRDQLARHGIHCRSSSDTETVCAALTHRGFEALASFRGMYALAHVSSRGDVVTLARDPLGIKPLYLATLATPQGPVIAFASEIRALAALPFVRVAPDLAGIASYLATIRTTHPVSRWLERTLIEGVFLMAPGVALEINVRSGEQTWRQISWPQSPESPLDPREARARVRETVTTSLTSHLRSDVPLCGLLSGGLDSTILTALAARQLPRLWTYAAGAEASDGDGDLAFADRVSRVIDSSHAKAVVSERLFLERWQWLVSTARVPLSTPNEVAIHEVAARLRQDGMVVTLSGEGADELFGGYDHALRAILARLGPGSTNDDIVAACLAESAWISPDRFAGVLRSGLADHMPTELDLARNWSMALAGESLPDAPLDAMLRVQRRINLHGLLLRLDSSTMRASVEGRTPFADVVVAAMAESLPSSVKFDPSQHGPTAGKRVLREAFTDLVPAEVITRPKASFPLPFQAWMHALAAAPRQSPLCREFFSDDAIAVVERQPAEAWRLAWPMINIALFARAWGW